jgi:predicted lipoprotein with Yx(FWY)xxD motif
MAMTRLWTAAAALAGVAVIAAGCGSGGSNSTSSGSNAAAPAGSGSSSQGGRYGYGASSGAGMGSDGSSSSSPALVAVRRLPVGAALVGPDGRTLYLFEKDTRPSSTCTGACAKGWPPLMTSAVPKAAAGVDASLLSAIKRPGGGQQVAYAGHPLYYFAGDRKAGQDTGQGLSAFGADWYVVAPSGEKIDEG